MDRAISGAFWISLYLLVVLVPLGLMLLPPVPSGRPFLVELSIALGFVGLTQIAVQFLLIARFRRLTAPYGIDIILSYHRQIAVVAIVLIVLHPILLFVEQPYRLVLLHPARTTLAGAFGMIAVVALLTTAVLSLTRAQSGLRYEHWRLAHIVLGVTALVSAQAHVSLAGLYTNTLAKHAVWIVSAAAMAGLVLWLRIVKPLLQRYYSWRVVDVRPVGGSTHVLALEADSHPGMRFLPGQFAWIKLAGTPFTLEEHPFSFCSSAEGRTRVEFGIKSLGDFTSRIPDVAVGTRAFLDGPHGAFSVDRYPAVGYVFVAGGIGISPILSFLRTMADRNDPRPVLLIYADRSWDDLAFVDEVKRLEDGPLDLRVVYVLEHAHEGWTGRTGLITRELLDAELPHEDFPRQYFVCGPPMMMDVVERLLRELGVPVERVQLERFALI